MLLALVIFVGLPIATSAREHVSVDLLVARLPGPLRRGFAVLAAVITALVLMVLAWRLSVSASDFTAYGDATVYLGIPLGPVAAAMAGSRRSPRWSPSSSSSGATERDPSCSGAAAGPCPSAPACGVSATWKLASWKPGCPAS
ncbi:MAG: TRAP transporter small permease [Alphaproteobacteria bacterium]|nr:TRAP transporter small permease [Alphaproteobacteria bacterium]